jgi:hypothetical protein
MLNFRIQNLILWLRKAGGKEDKLLFRNEREAVEFVRRACKQGAGPTEKFRAMYRIYDEAAREQKNRENRSNAA